MSNEIVKYSNEFNRLALRKFDSVHLDVLMSIAAKVRDHGTDEVTLTYSELRTLMRAKRNMTTDDLTRAIVEANARLLSLTGMVMDGRRIIQFTLFTSFDTDPESQVLKIRVNRSYIYLFNDLTAGFTRFELKEFADLRSRYAKEFYRRAKQFRRSGLWAVDREEFCRLLDVPPATAANVRDLNRRVLKPIQDEIGPLLNLKINRKYSHESGKRGRGSLSGFVFTFSREEPPAGNVAKAEYRPGKTGRRKTEVSELDIQRVMKVLGSEQTVGPEQNIAIRRQALKLLRDHATVQQAIEATQR